MKFTSGIILLVLIASGYCDDTTSIAISSTESTSTHTTDAATTTRQPDTTTVSSTTTTTTEPPTTTELPTTTTSTIKLTTTSVPITTTTPRPTTIPPITTTKSPEPPTPVESFWNVTEGNLTCIRAYLKVRFSIPVQDHAEYIILSQNADSNGDCKLSNTTQMLQLRDSEYTLTLIFEKDSNNAYLKNISFTYTLPDSRGTVYNDTKLFTVKLGNSYMCNSTNDVNLKNVTMEVFSIRIQSFGSVGNKEFGTAEECEADNKVNDMVPIAVGIALLVLVVVVLVAYFVGRRRSRQKGYQSV